MNLHNNFTIKYLNFSGFISKETGIFYYFDYLEKGDKEKCKNLSNEELLKIFDTFYGGSVKIENGDFQERNNLELRKIIVRGLYFHEKNREKIVAIGHIQKDLWISKQSDKLISQNTAVDIFVNNYLITMFKQFPRRIDIFLTTLKDNSYEICKLLENESLDPLNYWEVFEEVAKNYIQRG